MLFLQKQQGLVATKRKNFVFPASSSRCRHMLKSVFERKQIKILEKVAVTCDMFTGWVKKITSPCP